MAPAGDTCLTAGAPITATTTLTNQTNVGFTNDYNAATVPNCGFATMPGLDRAYAVTIPAGQRLTAVASPSAAFDVGIDLVAGPATNCAVAPRVCLAGDDNGGAGVAESASFSNTTAAAQTIFVIIDAYTTTATGTGTFSLALTIDAIPPAPANDTCATAQTITLTNGAGTATGDTSSANNSNALAADGGTPTSPSCSSAAASTGKDVVYTYTIATVQNVAITVTPSLGSQLTPAVYVRPTAQCTSSLIADERVCVSSTPYTAQILNQPAGTYSVWVDGTGGTSGPFTIAVNAATPPPPPANDTCATAQTVTLTNGMGTATGDTTSANNSNSLLPDGGAATSPSCTATAATAGKDVIFNYTLASAQNVTVTATPSTGSTLTPAVYVKPSNVCTSPFVADELACGAPFAIAPATVTIAQSAGTYSVWVDGTGSSFGPFSLSITAAAPPAGDVCSTATALTAGTLSNQSTTGFANNYSPTAAGTNCTGYGAVGPDRVYTAAVPAGQTLTVVVTPTGVSAMDGDPSLYVLANVAACIPAPTACLAGKDNGVDGDPETLVWLNNTGAAANVLVVIDGFAGTPYTYNMVTTIQ